MINVNDAGVFFVVRRRERRRASAHELADLNLALRVRPHCAKLSIVGAGMRGTPGVMAARRARGHRRRASRSSTRPTPTSRSRCSSPTTQPARPNRRCTTSSRSDRSRQRSRMKSLGRHPHRDDHARSTSRVRSTSTEAVRLAKFLVDRGNDGVVVAGTTGEVAGARDGREARALRRDQGGAGQRRHRHRRNDRQQHAPFGRADEGRGEDRRRRDPRDRAVLQQADPGRLAAALRRDRRGDVAPGHPLQRPQPHRRQHAARRPCTSSRDATRTSSRSRNPPATRNSSRRSCATRATVFTVWSGDDYFFLPALALGGYGVVSVAGHICAAASCARWPRRSTPATSRRPAASTAISRALFAALFAITSPIPVKWAMNEFGFKAGECRSPLGRDAGRPQSDASEPLIAPFRPDARGPRSRSWGAASTPSDRPKRSNASPRSRTARSPAIVVTLGVEMVMDAQRDARFRALVNRAALSLCDTVGILLASRAARRPAARARDRRST